ncbi:hypothetical protein CYMTET_43153 [Cymbomonas tetramitiformis]|uniref:Photosynthesis system II assembly factor Ycf48/Hcf136-like domain-containing protein n=1 Tax=Cymbomonas tetramitiformis TaxID=36881 RepID=A0AAE0F0J6_9CHLO|nr:hypothetical protein CYMTET_43153 [Cymbomonas tetramitiformis]
MKWTDQYTYSSSTLKSVDFVDRSTGWAAGDAGSLLFTADSGLSWQKKDPVPGTGPFDWKSISFASSSVGWLVGNAASILYTTDEGHTWQFQSISFNPPPPPPPPPPSPRPPSPHPYPQPPTSHHLPDLLLGGPFPVYMAILHPPHLTLLPAHLRHLQAHRPPHRPPA